MKTTLVRMGVKDKFTEEIVYVSRWTEYQTAVKRAVKWCDRVLEGRGTIVQVDYKKAN